LSGHNGREVRVTKTNAAAVFVAWRVFVELPAGIALNNLRAEAPATIHGQHAKVLFLRRVRLRKDVREERRSGRKS